MRSNSHIHTHRRYIYKHTQFWQSGSRHTHKRITKQASKTAQKAQTGNHKQRVYRKTEPKHNSLFKMYKNITSIHTAFLSKAGTSAKNILKIFLTTWIKSNIKTSQSNKKQNTYNNDASSLYATNRHSCVCVCVCVCEKCTHLNVMYECNFVMWLYINEYIITLTGHQFSTWNDTVKICTLLYLSPIKL